MNSKKSNRLKKIVSSIILNCFSLIYGFSFLLCFYWLLRLDTWTERLAYITSTILTTKVLTVPLTKLLISFTRSDDE
ncbi:hypothetical protein B6O77_001941 [Salmonella enterica subsp. enterica serovar Mississippi]|nr:hypothetical protein [Salmonella enterica subsp. enterica serovar Mississippi]